MTTKPLKLNERTAPKTIAILQELGRAGIHTADTLRDVFDDKPTYRHGYIEIRIRQLLGRGIIGDRWLAYSRNSTIQNKHIYYLTKLGAVIAGFDREEIERVAWLAKNIRGMSIDKHDTDGVRFRSYLVRDPSITVEYDTMRQGLGIYAEEKQEGVAKEVEVKPDRYMIVTSKADPSKSFRFFVEVHEATYAIRSRFIRKLSRYESLYEKDEAGVRWRVSHLGIDYFRLIVVYPGNESSNPELQNQVFDTIRDGLADAGLKRVSKGILFCNLKWQSHGEPVVVEDFEGNRRPLLLPNQKGV